MKRLSFSSQFPKKHIREGQATNFHELIERDVKTTTIRGKCPLQVGEVFEKFVWGGEPYQSKWTHRELLRVVAIDLIEIIPNWTRVFVDYDKELTEAEIAELARKDGLSVDDFWSWFGLSKQGFQGFLITFERV